MVLMPDPFTSKQYLGKAVQAPCLRGRMSNTARLGLCGWRSYDEKMVSIISKTNIDPKKTNFYLTPTLTIRFHVHSALIN